MNLLKLLITITVIFLITACSNKNSAEIDIAEFHSELTPWLDFYKKYDIKLDEFKYYKEDSLQYLAYNVDTFDLQKDIYSPFYKYSSDSSKVLDLVSYNLVLELDDRNRLISFRGAIDCEVYIKCLQDKICQKILFLGPSYMVEDGFWINDNKILLIGQNMESVNNNVIPMIWFIDINKGVNQSFKYDKAIKNMKCDFIENEKFKEAIIDFN